VVETAHMQETLLLKVEILVRVAEVQAVLFLLAIKCLVQIHTLQQSVVAARKRVLVERQVLSLVL
jgi:hypothetical protein